MKILIIEDDPQIVEVITLSLRMRWPEAKIISTHLGETGLEMTENESPTVVILDLGLPDISGHEVLKGIRLFSKVPVIILTSRDDEADVIRGLEGGANDYVTKPFRQMELVARVKAVTRQHTGDGMHAISVGDLQYDPARLEFIRKGKKIVLTRTEGDIMHVLMKNAGQLVPYYTIAEAVWGSDAGAVEAIKVYVRRMREKLEDDPAKPELITTRPGAGYMLNIPSKQQ